MQSGPSEDGATSVEHEQRLPPYRAVCLESQRPARQDGVVRFFYAVTHDSGVIAWRFVPIVSLLGEENSSVRLAWFER